MLYYIFYMQLSFDGSYYAKMGRTVHDAGISESDTINMIFSVSYEDKKRARADLTTFNKTGVPIKRGLTQ